MPHSFGYRARTRHAFSQPFRKHGLPSLTKYLTTYKLGDHVDIKVNGAIHKGMPHRFYQGRTGVVWNVTPRAVGVEINKQVRNRIVKKRIHVRIEHVQPSRCKEDFYRRVKANAAARKHAKETKSEYTPKSSFYFLCQNKILISSLPSSPPALPEETPCATQGW